MVDAAVMEADGRLLDTIDDQQLIDHLARRGAVLLRGFATDRDAFAALTVRLSTRFTCDPAKFAAASRLNQPGLLGEAARLANRLGSRVSDLLPGSAGVRLGGWLDGRTDDTRAAPTDAYGINPHNENTFIPGAHPELVWFLCERPATDGGATVLCDGTVLWDVLSDRARHLARSEAVRYELTLGPSQWAAVYDTDTPAGLAARLDGIAGVTWDLDRHARLHYRYDVDQVGATVLGGVTALSTNVLSRRPYGEVGDPEPEQLASGGPVPSWFVEELLTATAEHRIEIDLEPGDVLLLDNSRVLHGRTPFADPARLVLTRCSWLAPDLVAI